MPVGNNRMDGMNGMGGMGSNPMRGF